jgi:hypothetical protein
MAAHSWAPCGPITKSGRSDRKLSMQDDDTTSKVDDLVAKGKKLEMFSVTVTYQSFISDYGRKGGKAFYIAIKCNGKVRQYRTFPIYHDGPFDEMISSYVKSALADDLVKAADKTINDAMLGTARYGGDVLDLIEFSEGAPLEKSRIEKVLAKGQEVVEGRITEEAIAAHEKLEEIEQLLAEYENAKRIWKDIGAMREQIAGYPIAKQVRAIQEIHEDIPAELIEEFLRDKKMKPSDMAYVHCARTDRRKSLEAAKQAINRAKREKSDILRKQQMSPKTRRKE